MMRLGPAQIKAANEIKVDRWQRSTRMTVEMVMEMEELMFLIFLRKMPVEKHNKRWSDWCQTNAACLHCANSKQASAP